MSARLLPRRMRGMVFLHVRGATLTPSRLVPIPPRVAAAGVDEYFV